MKNTLIGKLYPLWLSSQTDLNDVIRWSHCLDDENKMRRQSTMAHTVSVCLVIQVAIMLLKKHNPDLDVALLQRAFQFHDISEGLLKRDIMYHHKVDNDDVNEFFAFEEQISGLPTDIRYQLIEAFLLQFAEKNSEAFPERARHIMTKLWDEKRIECLCFAALESWEYHFYAHEMEESESHEYLLTWVLRKQTHRLQEYAKSIPGFREEIFTLEHEEFALSYLEEHSHVPQQK